jgi:hypothetical protein
VGADGVGADSIGAGEASAVGIGADGVLQMVPIVGGGGTDSSEEDSVNTDKGSW